MEPTTTREKVRHMRFGRGLKPREIATLLNISSQAVYKHLARIKADDEKREEGAA